MELIFLEVSLVFAEINGLVNSVALYLKVSFVIISYNDTTICLFLTPELVRNILIPVATKYLFSNLAFALSNPLADSEAMSIPFF